MRASDPRKCSFYIPHDLLLEIRAEADRQDRSLSWIVQQAWKLSRAEVRAFPSIDDVLSRTGT